MTTQAKKLQELNNRTDELNPNLMLGGINTQLLTEALNGAFDITYLLKKELANRGLDEKGIWVGFDKAKQIHQI